MEAKSRLNDDGTPIINCQQFEYSCGTLWNGRNRMQFCEADLDALFAVLKAREMAKEPTERTKFLREHFGNQEVNNGSRD